MKLQPVQRVVDDAYLHELRSIAAEHGLEHTGVAPATMMTRARDAIDDRVRDGHHDGMKFTFKNPQRSTDPTHAVAGAEAVFVGALPYLIDDEVKTPDRTDNSDPDACAPPLGSVAKYAWADHYGVLRDGLWAVARQLRRDGWKAVPFADDNAMVDREIAYRAGLGWFGKNANLLIAGAGSFFVLGSVITTCPLPVAAAPVADGCGPCRRCLDACPTAAIVEPGVIDARRCLAWLLQKPGVFDRRFRIALGDRMYGCDDCQDSCPPSVRLGRRVTRPATGPLQRTVDVLAVLAATDEAVLATWGRWYIAERDPRWVRRNALVVLGNIGSADDAQVVATVAEYLAHDDVVLRAHAVWSARRLGLDRLLPIDDPDPVVREELLAPL